MTYGLFKKRIHEYYRAYGRSLPWRTNINPYRVFVSEMMLQQTQVLRVLDKYHRFIRAVPSFQALAEARFADVLSLWQGLGYNRRALYLKKAARIVAYEFDGELPEEASRLQQLPGIGAATAGAISAFAFNRPEVFIETNIRSVFIHFFFRDQAIVSDGEILPLVEKTLDYDNPRLWYYALMDYGVMLKDRYGNPNTKSRAYHRQSSFRGSNREIRGKIIKAVSAYGAIADAEICRLIGEDKRRVKKILEALVQEGLLRKRARRYAVAEV